MVSVSLPSDALSQHLPSYLVVGYLLPWLWGISSWLLLQARVTPPDLERGVGLLALLCPRSHRSLDMGLLFSAAAPDLGRWVAPLGGASCAVGLSRLYKNKTKNKAHVPFLPIAPVMFSLELFPHLPLPIQELV